MRFPPSPKHRQLDSCGRWIILTASAAAGALLLATALLAGCGGGDRTTATAADTSASMGDAARGPNGIGTVIRTPAGAGYLEITPNELAEMLESKDFLLINVHIPYEGEIEQTDLFIPFDQAAQRISELPEDRSAKIVVYCRSDRMSGIAVQVWADAGYANLYDLNGGFVAWEDAGYPLLHLDRQ